MKLFSALTLFFIFSINYSNSKTLPPFKATDQPVALDYSSEKSWSCLPFRKDASDAIPKIEKWIDDSLKNVDVFYIYPTIYMKGKTWNADATNKKLNKKIDKYPVKFQASVFNQVGRIYAPRYRQAHIKSFYDSTENGKAALDFAYEDVKKAFEYYLRNYNNGRPIIIASHSQGSFHARRLLKDYFDTPEMKQKLVCAYVIGFGIYPEKYELLKPCNDALATNCYVTWSSFKKGYTPENVNMLFGKICVNPISWKTNNEKATSKSGILLNLNRKKLFKSEVQIKENYLWVKTNMLIVRKINVMHLADYNLYWYDIRKNVADRVTEYWKKK